MDQPHLNKRPGVLPFLAITLLSEWALARKLDGFISHSVRPRIPPIQSASHCHRVSARLNVPSARSCHSFSGVREEFRPAPTKTSEETRSLLSFLLLARLKHPSPLPPLNHLPCRPSALLGLPTWWITDFVGACKSHREPISPSLTPDLLLHGSIISRDNADPSSIHRA